MSFVNYDLEKSVSTLLRITASITSSASELEKALVRRAWRSVYIAGKLDDRLGNRPIIDPITFRSQIVGGWSGSVSVNCNASVNEDADDIHLSSHLSRNAER